MGDSWNRKLTHQLYMFMYKPVLLFNQYPITVNVFLNEHPGLSLNL